jgi:hypothetical protein
MQATPRYRKSGNLVTSRAPQEDSYPDPRHSTSTTCPNSARKDQIIAAMIESARVARRQADYTVKKLNERRRRRANPANQSSDTTQ